MYVQIGIYVCIHKCMCASVCPLPMTCACCLCFATGGKNSGEPLGCDGAHDVSLFLYMFVLYKHIHMYSMCISLYTYLYILFTYYETPYLTSFA